MIHYLRNNNRKGADIYVFGCGISGQNIFTALTVSGIVVKGFFDNSYPEGGKLRNTEILPLCILEGCDREKTYIIIASRGRKDIEKQLKEMGIIHIIDRRELAIDYHSDFPVLSFDICKTPEVSILVTACNEWQYTYNCFYSLLHHKIQTDYEIIFGEDVSTDMNKIAEQFLHGVQVVHNQERMNYLGNVNNIAKLAKGDFIVLLANDTVIMQDYWIDRMLDIMKNDKNVGMVSGKYWIPSIGEYDTAFNYGDNWEEVRLRPDDHLQAVDFVWPVASMIRKSVWDSIGGFSEEFLPAFREDNDLCMKIIHKGYKCIYVPDIETIHFRGTSYERNEDSLYLMEKNYNLFVDKWKNYKKSSKTEYIQEKELVE